MSDQVSPEIGSNLKVLIYSDDRAVRSDVMLALGKRPAPDLAELEYVECATGPALIGLVDKGRFDLLILDGEATPVGGMGVARQLKDEIFNCPPILVLIARPQDAWLATWSRAEAVSSHPINAVLLADAVTGLLRPKMAKLSAIATA